MFFFFFLFLFLFLFAVFLCVFFCVFFGCTIYSEGRVVCSRYINIGLRRGVRKTICFKLIMLDTTKLYSMIPQDHRLKRKPDLVHSLCCKVVLSKPNVRDDLLFRVDFFPRSYVSITNMDPSSICFFCLVSGVTRPGRE